MDENTFIRGCVELISINNVPFKLFDSKGFKTIVGPMCIALGIHINSSNIVEKIDKAAKDVRDLIAQDANRKCYL